jgi:hypothetical protein
MLAFEPLRNERSIDAAQTDCAWFSMNQVAEMSRQKLMDQAAVERERIREWLLPYMMDGKPKSFTKGEYRQLATAYLGSFSKAAFDHAWIAAIEDSGRQDWYEPLSRHLASRH